MLSYNLVNSGSDNGMLPDCTKPLLKPMSNHQLGLLEFTWVQCHRKYISYISLVWVSNLRWQPHLPGADEFRNVDGGCGSIVPAIILNSLATGRFQFDFRKVIFKLTLVNGYWGISDEIVLRWMPKDLTDDTSTLVQVMAWCHQATNHYLSQCWPQICVAKWCHLASPWSLNCLYIYQHYVTIRSGNSFPLIQKQATT